MKNRLKQLRQEKNLSLRELADIVKISYSALSLAENEKRNLTDSDIEIFCKFYNVSSDYLLCLTNDKKPKTVQQQNIDNIDLAFYNQHGIVSEAQKKEIESFIEFIKSKNEAK